MRMAYRREIKVWVCERNRQRVNGMLDAWIPVLSDLPDARLDSASFLAHVARAGQHNLQGVFVNIEGEPA